MGRSQKHTEIALKIDHDPSGDFTLRQRANGQFNWDEEAELSGRNDRAAFYEDVVKHMSSLTHRGHVIVDVTDTWQG